MASRQICNGLEHLSIQDSSPPITNDHCEQHDRPRIHFFDLPSEIRNHIYRFCVPTGCGVRIWSEDLRKSMKKDNERCAHLKYPTATPDSTKMFIVNRQMRQEAASIYCSENFFVFDKMDAVTPFLQDWGPDLRGYISSIHLVLYAQALNWWGYGGTSGSLVPWMQAFEALAQLPNLRVKHLRLSIFDYNYDRVENGYRFEFTEIEWLTKLSEVTDLESLAIAFRPYCDGSETQLNSVTEDRLWDFLAPKMLKNEGNDRVHQQSNQPIPCVP